MTADHPFHSGFLYFHSFSFNAIRAIFNLFCSEMQQLWNTQLQYWNRVYWTEGKIIFTLLLFLLVKGRKMIVTVNHHFPIPHRFSASHSWNGARSALELDDLSFFSWTLIALLVLSYWRKNSWWLQLCPNGLASWTSSIPEFPFLSPDKQ